jgi:nucleoside-diphosphate-sugar epimerase
VLIRVLVTGGSGVLGTTSIPLLRDAEHTVDAPGRTELDLFDPEAVAVAVADKDAIVHLATRIPPPERLADREAWRDTDRLRAEATPILVDGALAASVEWFLFPSIAFVYPESGEVDESTPVADTVPEILLSALEAERHARALTATAGAASCCVWACSTGRASERRRPPSAGPPTAPR